MDLTVYDDFNQQVLHNRDIQNVQCSQDCSREPLYSTVGCTDSRQVKGVQADLKNTVTSYRK